VTEKCHERPELRTPDQRTLPKLTPKLYEMEKRKSPTQLEDSYDVKPVKEVKIN
jgi:hypothetical protein